MGVRLTTESLAEITRGRAGLSALVLLAASLAVVAVSALIWFFGSRFDSDGARVFTGIFQTVWLLVGSIGLFLTFGYWGPYGGGGEEYVQTFRGARGWLLGFFRWILQIATVAALFLGMVFGWGGAKPWQIFGSAGTHELRHTAARLSGYWKKGVSEVGVTLEYAEPEKLEIARGEHFLERHALMPVPDVWVRYDTSEGDNATGTSVHMSYGIPETDGIDDIEAWLTDTSAWTEFGELSGQGCRDTGSGSWLCRADVDKFSPDRVGRSPYERLSVSYYPGTSTVRVQLRLPSAES